MRRTYTASQIVGALACAASVLWLVFVSVLPGVAGLTRAQDGWDALFQVALPLALSGPGIALLVCSWKLLRGPVTRDRIKNVLGILAGFTALFGGFFLSWQMGKLYGASESSIDLMIYMFVAVAAVLPTYAWAARCLMRASEIVPVKGEFIGAGSFQILAFLLWAVLSGVGQDLHERYPTDSLLDFGFFFVPFIIPYVLYRMAVKHWVRDTFDEQVALDYPSHQDSEEFPQGERS